MSRQLWPDSKPGFPLAISYLYKYPQHMDSLPKPIGYVSTLTNVTISGATTIRGGAMKLVTAGADLDGANFTTHGSPFKGNLGTYMKVATRFSIDTDVTQSWAFFGFSKVDTDLAGGVPSDGIWFAKNDGDAGLLKAVIRRGSVNTLNTTVFTVVLATLMDLEIQVLYDTNNVNTAEVRFLVNGVVKYVYNGSGVPDIVDVAAGFNQVLELKAGSAAANTFHVVGQAGYADE